MEIVVLPIPDYRGNLQIILLITAIPGGNKFRPFGPLPNFFPFININEIALRRLNPGHRAGR